MLSPYTRPHRDRIEWPSYTLVTKVTPSSFTPWAGIVWLPWPEICVPLGSFELIASVSLAALCPSLKQPHVVSYYVTVLHLQSTHQKLSVSRASLPTTEPNTERDLGRGRRKENGPHSISPPTFQSEFKFRPFHVPTSLFI